MNRRQYLSLLAATAGASAADPASASDDDELRAMHVPGYNAGAYNEGAYPADLDS